jgi:hypothetical protein
VCSLVYPFIAFNFPFLAFVDCPENIGQDFHTAVGGEVILARRAQRLRSPDCMG